MNEASKTDGEDRMTIEKRPVNCDQVSWMLSAIDRYLPPTPYPSVSRAREVQKYGLLYELMEVANLCFEDDAAQRNGTPPDVRMLRWSSKRAEQENAQYAKGGCAGMQIAGNGASALGKLLREGAMHGGPREA